MHGLIAVLLLVSSQSALSLECGIMNDDRQQSRIVGGKDVTSYKYPWFASLHPPNDIHFQACAGTLVTVRHVLTAGHCFQPKDPVPLESLYDVTLGMFNHCNEPGSDARRTFKVAKVVVNENFVRVDQFDDITVLTLGVDDTGFMPVCMPLPGAANPHSNNGLIMGFGLTKFKNAQRPCAMSEATVEIFTKDECHKSLFPHDTNEEIAHTDKVFCAGSMAGNTDTCQGDSGGGLTLRVHGRYIIKGIVSFGYGCATKQEPGVYTNVAYYFNWINNTINNEQRSTPQKETPYQPYRPNILGDLLGYFLG